MPRHELTTLAQYTGDDRQVTSRHKQYEVDGRYRITGDAGMNKDELYGSVLRGVLAEQVAAIRDPNRPRLITERDAYASLEAAVVADELAQRTPRPAHDR